MLARGVELVLSCRRPSPETHNSQRQLCAQRAHRGVPRDCLQPNMELPVTVAEEYRRSSQAFNSEEHEHPCKANCARKQCGSHECSS